MFTKHYKHKQVLVGSWRMLLHMQQLVDAEDAGRC